MASVDAIGWIYGGQRSTLVSGRFRARNVTASKLDMTMHYVHNRHKARDAQAQFIERFLPNNGTVTDVEEQPDKERVPVRVQ